jgi:hypothetical protein
VKIPLSWLQLALAVVVVLWAGWLFQLWQPARQVERHTENFLRRTSARDWPAVRRMVAEDYRDAWDHNPEELIDDARELLSHFFTLQIVPLEPPVIRALGREGSATARLGVFGSGTAVAHAVMDAVREVEEPFVFRWRRAGPWPWQWELTEASHEELASRYRRKSW